MATPIVLPASGLKLDYYEKTLENRICRPVTVDDRPLLDELIQRMINFARGRNAMGLAAPQVGVYIQLAIVRPPDLNKIHVLINPEITTFGGRDLIDEEACLSIPPLEASARVTRSEIITLETGTLDHPTMRQVTRHKGMEARIIQHEVDHLQGVFFIQRISHLQHGLVLKRYAKWRKKVGLPPI